MPEAQRSLGADREQLRPAARDPPRRRATPVAGRSGRAGRRSAAPAARVRPARDRAAPRSTRRTGCWRVEERVTFRHPLARSAVYRSAGGPERRAAHLALAQVDGSRRRSGSPRVASRCCGRRARRGRSARELELSAGRAQARGGHAAAAAFLQRAVALTGDPARRADRALAAAQASLGAGAFDVARRLLATAEAGPLDELGRARIDLLRAEIVVRAEPRQRRPAAAAPGREEARAARRTPLPRHVSRCMGRGAVRRPSRRRRRRPARRLPRRGDRTRSGGSRASARPAARRSRADLHRGARRRDADAAARGRRVHERRGLRRGGAAMGLAGVAGGDLAVGLRRRPRDPGRARSSSHATPGRSRSSPWRTTCAARPPCGAATSSSPRC